MKNGNEYYNQEKLNSLSWLKKVDPDEEMSRLPRHGDDSNL